MPLTLAATTGQQPQDGWTFRHGRVIPRPYTPVSPAFGARLLERIIRAEAAEKRHGSRRRTKRSAA